MLSVRCMLASHTEVLSRPGDKDGKGLNPWDWMGPPGESLKRRERTPRLSLEVIPPFKRMMNQNKQTKKKRLVTMPQKLREESVSRKKWLNLLRC